MYSHKYLSDRRIPETKEKRERSQERARAETVETRVVYCISSHCLINSGHGLAITILDLREQSSRCPRPRSLSPMGGNSHWDRPMAAARRPSARRGGAALPDTQPTLNFPITRRCKGVYRVACIEPF